jgi:DNA polymerase III gamma/tau subunit
MGSKAATTQRERTMSTTTELIKSEGLSPAIVFGGEGLDPVLEQITVTAKSLVPDLTTAKGRKEIASMANKVARSKTLLDGLGKDLVAGRKAEIKKVDEERKRMRDCLDALKAEVRQPLTNWEDAEKRRVDYHTSMIKHIQDCGIGFIGGDPQPFGILFRELEEKIIVDERFEEFEAEAHRAKEAALAKLRTAFEEQQKREAEQAELERLRKEAVEREQKEREERIAREAKENAEREAQAKIDAERKAREDAERATHEAEARAKQQAIDAEAAERKAKADAEAAERKAKEHAERQAAEAEQRIKQEAEAGAQRERERIEQQKQAELAAQQKREADQKHKAAINNKALMALIDKAGLSEEQARNVVVAIAKRQIPAISISY